MDQQQQQGTISGNGTQNSSSDRISNSGPGCGSIIGRSGKQGISFGRGTFNKGTTTVRAVPATPTPGERFPIPFRYKKGKGNGRQKPSIQFGSVPVAGGCDECHAGLPEPAGDSAPAPSMSAEAPSSVPNEDLPPPPGTCMETGAPSEPWTMHDEDFPALDAVRVRRRSCGK